MKWIITILITFIGLASYGQEHRLYVSHDFRSSGSNDIVVKWVADQIIFPNGFNVYRKAEGQPDWTKLNNSPIWHGENEGALSGASDEIRQLYEGVIELPYGDLQEAEILRAFIALELLRTTELPEALGTVWYDNTTVNGTSYTYKVEGLSGSGIVPIGESALITAGGSYQLLSAPTGIIVDHIGDNAKLRWDLYEEEYTSVLVEHSIDGGEFMPTDNAGVYVIQAENESGEYEYPDYFITIPLEESSTHRFRFSSIDLFGQKGTSSKVFEITTRDCTPPPAPAGVTIDLVAPERTARLSWDYDERPEDLLGFVVLTRQGLDGLPVPLVADTSLAQTMEVSFPSTGNYILTVGAIDETGNMAESEPIGVEINDFTPPDQPANLDVEVKDRVAMLQWSSVTDRDVSGYYVYRYLGQKTEVTRQDYVVLNNEPLKDTVFVDSLDQVLIGSIYYAVAAVDSSANISELSMPASEVLPDEIAPSIPVFKPAVVTDDHVLLSWYPNVDADLEQFILFRYDSLYGNQPLAQLTPEDTSYTDKSIQAGTRYGYTLQAVDRSGNSSDLSEQLDILTTANEEGLLRAIRPGNIIVKYMKAKKQATLWWNQEFTEDNLGVVIYKGETKDKLRPVSGLLKTPEFRDTKVAPGNTYYYQLRTYASNGTRDDSTIKVLTIKADK